MQIKEHFLVEATNTNLSDDSAISYRERLILKVSVADDIFGMITSRSSHTDGVLQLSDSLDDLGLDSMEAFALTFDIEEKFNIQIPFNANMDIDSKILEDLIQTVVQLVAAKAKPA